jgi:hypothetical protein
VCSNFLVLLTALLTECHCNLRKVVIEIEQRIISKTTNFLAEVRTSRLDPAPSATASATYQYSERFLFHFSQSENSGSR